MNLLAVTDELRTKRKIGDRRWLARIVEETAALRFTEAGQKMLASIKKLRQHFEPVAVNVEKIAKARRRPATPGPYYAPGGTGPSSALPLS